MTRSTFSFIHLTAAFLLLPIIFHVVKSEQEIDSAVGSTEELPEGLHFSVHGDTVHDKSIVSDRHGRSEGSLRSKLEISLAETSADNAHPELGFNDYSGYQLEWPWNRNKTSDNSCATHQNCTDCTASSATCHWCSKDDQCHTIGSWHGCAIGATCPSNDTVDNSCKSHKSCSECSLASSVCHWCAFDDQCHSMASVYGCAHGVNCYSNDRCKRESPEKINEGTFDNIGFIPLFLIGSAAFGSLCCFSVLFSGAGALKGAYESLAANMTQYEYPSEEHQQDQDSDQLSPIDEEIYEEGEGEDTLVDAERTAHDISRNIDEEEESNESQLEIADDDDAPLDQTTDDVLTESLLPVTAHPHPSRLPPRSRNRIESPHMNCLMRSCKVWFFFSVVGVILFTTGGILYFPKPPEYNVCSDQFAWKSIIEGLTSLKMQGSFEILMSVKNENRLDVALEGFGGTFKHDGEDIGTFSLSRTIVQATSVTDLLVTCTVVPDRWEALGLISDYWKGKLALLVDVNGSVRIKGIGFKIPVKVSDVLVKVNDPDMKDRHLCACPMWKDLTPTASPKLSFEEAVESPVKQGISVD